jgi:hypothetical protein
MPGTANCRGPGEWGCIVISLPSASGADWSMAAWGLRVPANAPCVLGIDLNCSESGRSVSCHRRGRPQRRAMPSTRPPIGSAGYRFPAKHLGWFGCVKHNVSLARAAPLRRKHSMRQKANSVVRRSIPRVQGRLWPGQNASRRGYSLSPFEPALTLPIMACPPSLTSTRSIRMSCSPP